MKFTHLVEINDPLNPLIDRLSRTQLWRGLVLRAETPKTFVPQLDRCAITDKSELSLARELQYGELVVHDRVNFLPLQQVHYDIPPQKGMPHSWLTMTIEEPEENILFVRFAYDDDASEVEDTTEAFYNDFRKSAYKESDLDTVRIIRQLAAEGKLGD